MRGQKLLEQMKEGIVLGDGAVGTLLLEKGVSGDISYEQLNFTRPDVVTAISREYIAAGATVIETNSFCANAIKQRRFNLDQQVRELARKAAELARSVAGDNRFVAGALGPLARRKQELDEYTEGEIQGFFREAMQGLVEGGADLFMLETFTGLYELELALKTAKEFGIPVACQMAFGEEGTTELGVRAERMAQRAALSGADIIGSNCRSGPHTAVTIVERQAGAVDQPLSSYPNAGYAEQQDGRYVYGASPRYFASKVKELVDAGATLIGGCCGTTPEHIRAMAAAIEGLKPSNRKKVGKKAIVDEVPPDRRGGEKFLSLLNQDLFVAVEIDPPRGTTSREALQGARKAIAAGADAINIPDNSLASVRMDNVIFAQLVRDRLEVPVILHLTCRDKNMIALQSDLLGAQAVNIDAILAVTGDPASIGDQPGASSVYDMNSIGLVEMIASLNRGVTTWGAPLDKPTDLAIGVALNPNVRGPKGLEGALFKLRKKIAAGGQFAETQPIYDTAILRGLLSAMREVTIPICIGLMPIVSKKNADFFHNEVPGLKIPEEIRRRFEGLNRADGEREGVRLAKELIDIALEGGARHFYVVPPLHRYEIANEIVMYIRSSVKARSSH